MNDDGVARPTHARIRPGTRPVLRAVRMWSMPVIALGLGVASLLRADAADIGPLGLVTALRPGLYVALALLTASFVIGVFREQSSSRWWLAAHVVVLVVLLHGAASMIEPLPRMVSSWLHVGFADYIARTGETLPELDARFSWPGFFALVAMATGTAGMANAMPLLTWTPVVLNLLYCAAVYRLARELSPEPRTAWLAVWLFVPANWVGQDYFGPQAMNYLFYLVLLLALVAWFRGAPRARSRPPGRAVGWLRSALRLPREPRWLEPERPPLGPAALAGLIGIVLVVFAASTVSHQLTPVAAVVAVSGLVLVGSCTMRTLPVLLGVLLVAYISYGTVAYWSGHLDDVFGFIGRLNRTVSDTTVERVRGDTAHQIVVLSRLSIAALVWGLAAAGAWWRARRGQGDRALLALAGAPFLLPALQSYGGEMLLRVYAFALPFVVILVAAVPGALGSVRRVGHPAVLAGVLSLALIGSFFVARYGNEAFEQVRPADAQAVTWLYAHAPEGASLVSLTSNVPWRAQNIETYKYDPLGEDLGPDSLEAIEMAMRRNPRGAYLIVTEGQFVFAESFLGKPPGWGEDIERQLVESGRFRLVYTNPGARIYVLAAQESEA